jgi:DedD protein
MHTLPSSPKRAAALCRGLWAITTIACVTLLWGCSISPEADTSDSPPEPEQTQVEPPNWPSELTPESPPEPEQTQAEQIILPSTPTCTCTPELMQVPARPPADTALPMVTAIEHTTKAGTLVPGFYINVGLFAVPSNGTKAYKKLEDAGLAVFSDGIKTQKGHLTRVRVGPFNARTEADIAAKQIHTLKLEAVVFEH